jgi:hypothetical protein
MGFRFFLFLSKKNAALKHGIFLWILWVPGHPGDNMIQPTNSGTDGRYTAPSNRWFRLLRAFVGSLVPHFDRQIHIIIYIYKQLKLRDTKTCVFVSNFACVFLCIGEFGGGIWFDSGYGGWSEPKCDDDPRLIMN